MSAVLVTGGAGFIGSHLVDRLVGRGQSVRVLDDLEPPTHDGTRPAHLHPSAQLIQKPVGDVEALGQALDGVEAVFHLAASGGYRPGATRYVERNSLHTARLVDLLAGRPHRVKRLIVASSVAVYGEGAYRCKQHGPVYPGGRIPADLAAGRWELSCAQCGDELQSVPSAETSPPCPTRPYALSKYDQERLVLNAAREMGVEAAALRFFVTYGPRQALSNPYTGVISVFANRIQNGSAPVLYEDGLQTRDFIYVDDLVEALLKVLDAPALEYDLYNAGSGRPSTVADLAEGVARALGSELEPVRPGRWRLGDVRHISADTSRLAELGFKAEVSLEEGVRRYVEWFRQQPAAEDRFSQAEQEAGADGLIGKVNRA